MKWLQEQIREELTANNEQHAPHTVLESIAMALRIFQLFIVSIPLHTKFMELTKREWFAAPPAARYQFSGGSPMHSPTVTEVVKLSISK